MPRGKLDYNVMKSIKSLNEILNPEGVILKYINGDVATHSIFIIAFETGMEVDLLYGHHDNCKCDYCEGKGIFEGMKSNSESFFWRLFEWRLIRKPNSPFGYLPAYRFSAMDPTSAGSRFFWPRPANDGSSCTDMAKSLRDVLNADYKSVVSVNWGIISGEDFKNSVNKAWEWLDESTLLSKGNAVDSES